MKIVWMILSLPFALVGFIAGWAIAGYVLGYCAAGAVIYKMTDGTVELRV